MLPPEIAFISIATSLFAGYFYIRDILYGQTRPNLVSWSVWAIAPIIGSLIAFSKGANTSAIPVFMAGFVPLIVVLFSIKNKDSYWKFGVLDYVCFALSILAIIFWVFLKEGNLATFFAVLADFIAFIPTYVKSWKNPETENIWPYSAGLFNAALGVLTLSLISFNTAGFVFYLFIANTVQVAIVLYRRKIIAKNYDEKEKR